ncbi:MAG: hypothetical protein ACRDTE_24055 [Pseudonocardiaceae bacterium]
MPVQFGHVTFDLLILDEAHHVAPGPESEREIHRLLTRFAELRRRKLTSRRGHRATDLVTLLLKKRLVSSPSAFAHTVQVYLDTLKTRTRAATTTDDDVPKWMEDFLRRRRHLRRRGPGRSRRRRTGPGTPDAAGRGRRRDRAAAANGNLGAHPRGAAGRQGP